MAPSPPRVRPSPCSPITGGDTIDIGSTGTTTINRLELSNTELQTIAGSSLTIGSGTAGAVALVTADVTPGSTAGADLATVHIRSGSTITGTAAGIIETNLALSAGGTINLTDTNTDVDNLAVSAAGQTVTFTDTDDVDLDTVDGVTAITAATFNLNAAGAVTDTAASTISGTTTIAAGTGNNITLNNANDFGTLAITSGNDVTLADSNALTLGASTATGLLDVTAGGVLTLGGGLSSGGTTALTSTADDAGAITFNQGGQTISSTAGALTITADDMTLDGTITATGQSVTLQSNTGGDTIDIGSTGTTTINRLELSNAELQTIAGSSLTIGSGTAGAVALVTADVTPGSTAGADLATVHIRSGSTITGTAAGIIETNLALSAGGTVNFTDANTDVDNLAVSAPFQTVTFTDSDDVDLNTVDGVTAVTAATFNLNSGGAVTDSAASTISGTITIDAGSGNNVTLNDANSFGTLIITSSNDVTLAGSNALTLGAISTTGLLDVTAGGVLTLGGGISSGGTTALTSTADDAGAITFNQGGQTISSTAGALTITADDMTLDGTITATGQSVTLQSNSGGDSIDIGSTGTTTINRLELSNTELQNIAAGSLTIGSGTAGAVALVTADVTPGSTAGADLATVHIRSGSTITGTAAGIIETNLALTAGGTVNFTDANTDVDNLAVSAPFQSVTFTDK